VIGRWHASLDPIGDEPFRLGPGPAGPGGYGERQKNQGRDEEVGGAVAEFAGDDPADDAGRENADVPHRGRGADWGAGLGEVGAVQRHLCRRGADEPETDAGERDGRPAQNLGRSRSSATPPQRNAHVGIPLTILKKILSL